VLVIFAAAAACSTHDDAKGTDPLAQDRTLVARLEADRDARPAPLPAACGTVTVAAKPADASRTQAKELTLQAQGEEMKGNIADARSLLLRAAALDPTNQSTAYHLGRTNEALGDRAAAMTAYCRYLALTPSTTESAEARQRVSELSKTVTRVSAGSVTERAKGTSASPGTRATTRRVTRARRTVASHTASAPTVVQSAVTPAPARGGIVTESDAGGAIAEASPSVEAPASVEATATPSRTARRGPTPTQGAIVGAATGAIIGAATGRSVKGAVIGAAAGGLLGTVVGRSSRMR
jgi:hypothetical protein